MVLWSLSLARLTLRTKGERVTSFIAREREGEENQRLV